MDLSTDEIHGVIRQVKVSGWSMKGRSGTSEACNGWVNQAESDLTFDEAEGAADWLVVFLRNETWIYLLPCCVLGVTMSCDLKWNNHITPVPRLGSSWAYFTTCLVWLILPHSLISTNVSFYQPLTTVVWCGILLLHTSSLNRSLSRGLQQGWLPSATWQPS